MARSNSKHLVTESQNRLIARVTRLRARVYTVSYDVATEFARNAAGAWRDDGLAGLAGVCHALAGDLESVPGAWDCWTEARNLAFALACEVPAVQAR